jgi:hypothetical protein
MVSDLPKSMKCRTPSISLFLFRVNLEDYVILSRCWLSSKSQAAYDARADFDHDGLINVADLRLLAANWLRTSSAEVSPYLPLINLSAAHSPEKNTRYE